MALQQRRFHVGSRDWDNGAATDYWFNASSSANQTAAASATNPHGLSGWGWTTTATLTPTAGTAGDINTSADFTPTHLLMGATGVFTSPRVFGGYDQFQRVSDILGYVPTGIVLDFYAAFTVASANETTTFIGLNAPAVTDAAAAGGGGSITANGTNFLLTSDNGSDAGSAVANTWRKWRIQYGTAAGVTTTEWFNDIVTPGTLVSQGTITTELDIWPLSFKVASGTTNRIGLSWCHLYYGP